MDTTKLTTKDITGTYSEPFVSLDNVIYQILTTVAPQTWAVGTYSGKFASTHESGSGDVGPWVGSYLLTVGHNYSYGTRGIVIAQECAITIWYENTGWVLHNITHDCDRINGQKNVTIHTDGEGGNIRITSATGNHTEIDMVPGDSLRIYLGTPQSEVTGAIVKNINGVIDLDNLNNMAIEALQLSPTLGSAANYGRHIADALNVALYDPHHALNRIGYVYAGGTTSMPANCSAGIRTVEYYNSSAIRVTIHGWDGYGNGGNWYNFYNGTTWVGWTRDSNAYAYVRGASGVSGDIAPNQHIPGTRIALPPGLWLVWSDGYCTEVGTSSETRQFAIVRNDEYPNQLIPAVTPIRLMTLTNPTTDVYAGNPYNDRSLQYNNIVLTAWRVQFL